MGYNLSKIEYVKAVKVPIWNKTDVQVQVKIIIKLQDAIDLQNISVKLVSNNSGFNQIDKRWLKNYRTLWNIPENVYSLLAYFCGEKKPYKKGTRDVRRMFIDEMTTNEQNILIDFFSKNKIMIVSDIIRWRGEFCAEWMLVVRKTSLYEWALKPIWEIMNYYGNGEIKISPKWSILIWKITVQRKWWDGWRETANMLQFKIDPTKIMEL